MFHMASSDIGRVVIATPDAPTVTAPAEPKFGGNDTRCWFA